MMETDEEELYEVEKIIKSRREKNGRMKYLVRWRGYSAADDTWEPEENLHGCRQMLKEFALKAAKTSEKKIQQIPKNQLLERTSSSIQLECNLPLKKRRGRPAKAKDSISSQPSKATLDHMSCNDNAVYVSDSISSYSLDYELPMLLYSPPHELEPVVDLAHRDELLIEESNGFEPKQSSACELSAKTDHRELQQLPIEISTSDQTTANLARIEASESENHSENWATTSQRFAPFDENKAAAARDSQSLQYSCSLSTSVEDCRQQHLPCENRQDAENGVEDMNNGGTNFVTDGDTAEQASLLSNYDIGVGYEIVPAVEGSSVELRVVSDNHLLDVAATGNANKSNVSESIEYSAHGDSEQNIEADVNVQPVSTLMDTSSTISDWMSLGELDLTVDCHNNDVTVDGCRTGAVCVGMSGLQLEKMDSSSCSAAAAGVDLSQNKDICRSSVDCNFYDNFVLDDLQAADLFISSRDLPLSFGSDSTEVFSLSDLDNLITEPMCAEDDRPNPTGLETQPAVSNGVETSDVASEEPVYTVDESLMVGGQDVSRQGQKSSKKKYRRIIYCSDSSSQLTVDSSKSNCNVLPRPTDHVLSSSTADVNNEHSTMNNSTEHVPEHGINSPLNQHDATLGRPAVLSTESSSTALCKSAATAIFEGEEEEAKTEQSTFRQLNVTVYPLVTAAFLEPDVVCDNSCDTPHQPTSSPRRATDTKTDRKKIKRKPRTRRQTVFYVSSDDSGPEKCVKDTFWIELEQGKLPGGGLYEDMYSAVKSRRRRCQPLLTQEASSSCLSLSSHSLEGAYDGHLKDYIAENKHHHKTTTKSKGSVGSCSRDVYSPGSNSNVTRVRDDDDIETVTTTPKRQLVHHSNCHAAVCANKSERKESRDISSTTLISRQKSSVDAVSGLKHQKASHKPEQKPAGLSSQTKNGKSTVDIRSGDTEASHARGRERVNKVQAKTGVSATVNTDNNNDGDSHSRHQKQRCSSTSSDSCQTVGGKYFTTPPRDKSRLACSNSHLASLKSGSRCDSQSDKHGNACRCRDTGVTLNCQKNKASTSQSEKLTTVHGQQTKPNLNEKSVRHIGSENKHVLSNITKRDHWQSGRHEQCTVDAKTPSDLVIQPAKVSVERVRDDEHADVVIVQHSDDTTECCNRKTISDTSTSRSSEVRVKSVHDTKLQDSSHYGRDCIDSSKRRESDSSASTEPKTAVSAHGKPSEIQHVSAASGNQNRLSTETQRCNEHSLVARNKEKDVSISQREKMHPTDCLDEKKVTLIKGSSDTSEVKDKLLHREQLQNNNSQYGEKVPPCLTAAATVVERTSHNRSMPCLSPYEGKMFIPPPVTGHQQTMPYLQKHGGNGSDKIFGETVNSVHGEPLHATERSESGSGDTVKTASSSTQFDSALNVFTTLPTKTSHCLSASVKATAATSARNTSRRSSVEDTVSEGRSLHTSCASPLTVLLGPAAAAEVSATDSTDCHLIASLSTAVVSETKTVLTTAGVGCCGQLNSAFETAKGSQLTAVGSTVVVLDAAEGDEGRTGDSTSVQSLTGQKLVKDKQTVDIAVDNDRQTIMSFPAVTRNDKSGVIANLDVEKIDDDWFSISLDRFKHVARDSLVDDLFKQRGGRLLTENLRLSSCNNSSSHKAGLITSVTGFTVKDGQLEIYRPRRVEERRAENDFLMRERVSMFLARLPGEIPLAEEPLLEAPTRRKLSVDEYKKSRLNRKAELPAVGAVVDIDSHLSDIPLSPVYSDVEPNNDHTTASEEIGRTVVISSSLSIDENKTTGKQEVDSQNCHKFAGVNISTEDYSRIAQALSIRTTSLDQPSFNANQSESLALVDKVRAEEERSLDLSDCNVGRYQKLDVPMKGGELDIARNANTVQSPRQKRIKLDNVADVCCSSTTPDAASLFVGGKLLSVQQSTAADRPPLLRTSTTGVSSNLEGSVSAAYRIGLADDLRGAPSNVRSKHLIDNAVVQQTTAVDISRVDTATKKSSSRESSHGDNTRCSLQEVFTEPPASPVTTVLFADDESNQLPPPPAASAAAAGSTSADNVIERRRQPAVKKTTTDIAELEEMFPGAISTFQVAWKQLGIDPTKLEIIPPDPTFEDVQNMSSLHDAVTKDLYYIVKFAFENGNYTSDINKADINTKLTPLMIAASTGSNCMIELLVLYGADINCCKENTGDTALMLAASKGLSETVGLLLKAGACINVRDHQGESALHKAVLEGHLETAGVLLDFGAEVPVTLMLQQWMDNSAVVSCKLSRLIGQQLAILTSEYEAVAIDVIASTGARLVRRLFPIHSFNVRDADEHSIVFPASKDEIESEHNLVLCLTRAIVRRHRVHCWLNGTDFIAGVRLNQQKVEPVVAQVPTFYVLDVQSLRDTNTVSVCTTRDRWSKKYQLIVGAYVIDDVTPRAD